MFLTLVALVGHAFPAVLRELVERRGPCRWLVATYFPRERGMNLINPLTPILVVYSGRTAPLTSKRCILYIYSTNTGTEYFIHGIYFQFFSIQNAVCFIILTYLVPVLFTFCIQDVLKFKKIIPAPKG